jgi:hypothetical protein
MKAMLSCPAMRRRRWAALCAALAVATPSVLLSPALPGSSGEAHASVSIAISLHALVRSASAVVLATPTEQRSVWEGGRIYTYSHLRVDTAVVGELAGGSEGWVRTMGGIVGNVGQLVEGEAVFNVGRPSLVFLRRDANPSSSSVAMGHFVVAARAQGQFDIYADDANQLRVRTSRSVGGLVPSAGIGPPSPLAADLIDGRAVPDAAREIAAAWGRTHAP